MKVLLILPKLEHGVITYKKKLSWLPTIFGSPSIILPHIAALTPKEHSIKIINENHEGIDFDQNVDLVGISCFTMAAPHVYQIADEFRRRGKKVVLGGYHPTALSDEAKQHADSVVIGEAELVWPQLLKDLEGEKLKPFYKSDKEFDVSNIPPIRRDLIRHRTVLGGIQSTRGCLHRCEFCAITNFYNHGIKQRPIKDVVKEIKQMPNRLFQIYDPSLTVNPGYSRELFKALIQEKVKKGWVASGNVDVLARIDEGFLKLAKKSGCFEWFIGFESVNQAALNGIKKDTNRVEDFERMIKRIHDHGMTVHGGIIFGFDEDTPDIFDATLEKLFEWKIDILDTYILTPFPGTPLYDRLEKEKRILTKDWSRYNLTDVVFKPKNMTEKELFEGARKVAKEFYSMPRIITRVARIMTISLRPSFILPIGTNFIFRKSHKRDFVF